MLRHRVLLSVIFALLIISTPLMARESRIVGGDGVIGDTELASTIWRIGLCPITAGQDFGYHVAETANSAWPGAFALCGGFKVVQVPDTNPSTLTPDDIIRLGEEYGVDALVCGSVDQAKNTRNIWGSTTNPINQVAVMISFKLYETSTGTLLWERILKKDRGVPENEAEGLVERFAGNIVTDMVETLVADGITGRDLSLNAAPVIEFPSQVIECRTSAFHLEGMVTDDFGINEVAVSCGGNEAIRSWSVEQAPEFAIDAVFSCEDITGDSLTVIARDSQSVQSQIVLSIDFSESSIEGNIANISADSVFLNIGSSGGVEPGMIFTVSTSVDITDPVSGALLGSSDLKTGMVEVVSVDLEFSTCTVIDGNIEDMKLGDSVY
jgi:hypothetical protein